MYAAQSGKLIHNVILTLPWRKEIWVLGDRHICLSTGLIKGSSCCLGDNAMLKALRDDARNSGLILLYTWTLSHSERPETSARPGELDRIAA